MPLKVENHADAILVRLVDVSSWRKRRREEIEPLTQDSGQARSKFEFELSTQFVQAGIRAAQPDGAQAPTEASLRGAKWKQTIPVARLGKNVPHDFRIFDEGGRELSHLTRYEAAPLGALFLLWHLDDVFKTPFGKTQSWNAPLVEYFLGLLCFSNPTETSLEADRNGCKATTLKDFVDPKRTGTGSDLAWIREAVRPYVQNPDKAISQKTISQVARCLARQQQLVAKINESCPGLLSPACFRDPLANPLLLVADHAKIGVLNGITFTDADDALSTLLPIIDAFQDLCRIILLGNRKDRGGDWLGLFEEMRNFVHGWVVYVNIEVEVDRPFLLRLERLLQMKGGSKLPKPTHTGLWHFYEVPYGDAQSNHVEVMVTDPELVIRTGRKHRPLVSLSTSQGATSWVEPREIFTSVSHSPGRLHLYTARKRPSVSKPLPGGRLSMVLPPVRIAVPLRVRAAILVAYWIVLSGLVAAAGFSSALSATVIFAGQSETESSPLDDPGLQSLAVAAFGSVAVIVLFAVARHRHVLVEQRLKVLSWCILTCGAIIEADFFGALAFAIFR